MKERLQTLLREPVVPDPPARVWRDWALVAALLVGVVAETIFRNNVDWKIASIVVAVATLPAVLWRRTQPLAMLGYVFAIFVVVNILSAVTGKTEFGLYTSAFVLILIYALFRWGSGRHCAIGLGIMMVVAITGFYGDQSSLGDVIGGTIVLLFPAELGAIVRYQGRLRVSQVDKIKLHEREQLARELHDTVAHHISAIAIQAQAGRTLGSSEPEAAMRALETIEQEASRTLAEMRSMVGALRRNEEADLGPQRGVGDIERLAGVTTGGPAVHVKLAGDLDGLRPTLDATLYRMAQESITNATRHAKNATRVDVKVSGDQDSIRLTVRDDGLMSPNSKPIEGYGLIGMAERAKLLGGSLRAGPGIDRGWVIDAVLPRAGASG